MTKLEELIEKLCPDGVEYKEIGSIAVLGAGGDVPKARFSAEKTVEFNIPIYSNGIEEKAIYGYTDIPKVDEPSITISARGTIGWCALRKEPFYPIVRLIYVTPNNEILIDFLKYVIDTIKFKVPKTGIPQLTIPMVSKYKIPVPPLEVQREIVRILDNFAIATAEIQQKLQEELAARQKQYEYYRDLLLTFKPNESTILNERTNELELSGAIRWMKLGDIGSICMCKRILKSETNQNGGIPFYKIGTFGKQADAYISNEKFIEYKNRYKFPKKGDILISAAGTIGRTVVYDGKPAYFQDSNIVWIDNDETRVLNTFLNYWYSTSPWVASTGGTISRLYNDNIAKAPIPVPPLEVQQRIVDILDRFDTLCNDISSGLPAEIEMRQKQYEYYRDKLLTFKELKKEA